MDQPTKDAMARFACLADEIVGAIGCQKVADQLQLAGSGPSRYCPQCQAGSQQGMPRLICGRNQFQCFSCNAQGGPVELVQLARPRMSVDEALLLLRQWIHPPPPQRPPLSSSQVNSASAVPGLASEESNEHSRLFRAFLEGCRPIAPHVVALMEKVGISAAVLKEMGVCFYPADYQTLLRRLEEQFGWQQLWSAGLITAKVREAPIQPRGSNLETPPRLLQSPSACGSFRPYHEARAPYLLLPYVRGGQIQAIKARAMAESARLAAMKLPSSLCTSKLAPCLYNSDGIKYAATVYLFRHELDVLLSTSLGLPAAGYASLPGFARTWAQQLAGKDVICPMEAGHAFEHVQSLLQAFQDQGLPSPTILQAENRGELGRLIHELAGRHRATRG